MDPRNLEQAAYQMETQANDIRRQIQDMQITVRELDTEASKMKDQARRLAASQQSAQSVAGSTYRPTSII